MLFWSFYYRLSHSHTMWTILQKRDSFVVTRDSYFNSDQTAWKLESFQCSSMHVLLVCFLVFSSHVKSFNRCWIFWGDAKSCGRQEGLIYIERELSKEIIQTKWLKEDKTYSHEFNCLFLCSSHSLKHRMFFVFFSQWSFVLSLCIHALLY